MNIRTVTWLCWVEIHPFTKGWHTQFVWSWVYKILITNLSLSTHLVRLHELRGMTSRDLLCWAVVEVTYTPQGFLCVCVFRSTSLRVSWSQVVVGSITPSLGGQQPETDCSTGLETSKLPEQLCRMEGGQVSLKSRAWHTEWLINSGRSRRKIKLQFLQKNVSQRSLSHLLKISLQGPVWRSSRSRQTPW